MTDNEKQFEDFVRGIKFDDSPDPNHRDKLEQNLLRTLSKQPRQKDSPLIIWRTIMKSKIAKLATAAAVIILVAFGITFLDKSVTQAWAVEETAEALDQFNAIYISGVAAPSLKALEEGFDAEIVDALAKLLKDGRISVEFWARANKDRTQSGNIKVQTPDGMVGVADKAKTHIYDPNSNTVYIQQGSHIMINPWLSGDFLLKIQEGAEDWQVIYGRDAATGQDRAFITCIFPVRPYSMWIEIDLETSLPVRYKIWHNTRREGTPAYDMQRIVFFEELPDRLFEFEIPAGAKVLKYGFE